MAEQADNAVSPNPAEEIAAGPEESTAFGDQAPAKNRVTFLGNSYDVMSVVGVSTAGATLFACGTCGFGFYCLPLIPVILGAIGLLSLKDSVNPDRTKLLSWISIGVGAAFLLLILLLFLFYVLYFGLIFSVIASEAGSGGF